MLRQALVDFVVSCCGLGYVLGAQGEILTEERLNVLQYNYPLSSRAAFVAQARKWLGKRVFDCSGLIIYWLQTMGFTNKDYTANDMYKLSGLVTPITKEELLPGDLVFRDDGAAIGHVGVYIGDGRIVHARGTFYGVVETALFTSFNLFGRLKCIDIKNEGASMDTKVRDFQLRYNLIVDGIIGKQTASKAQEVLTLCQYILDTYNKPVAPTYTHRVESGAHIIEIDPLAVTAVYQSATPSVFAKTHRNFINGMFFNPTDGRLFCMLVVDGVKVQDAKEWDTKDKGTFIIYKDGSVEVKTVRTLSDVSNIKLAIQGFNCDYEANGSTSLSASLLKEGWLSDVVRTNMRPAIGYNYKTKKVVIVIKYTNADDIRTTMRHYGCIDVNNNTVALGLDSGGSTALYLNGGAIIDNGRTNKNYITWG